MPSPVTVYGAISDLEGVGISENALRGITPAQKTDALTKASRLMDGVFRDRYTLPLVQVGADVNMKCAFIAAFLLLSGRGFNPEKGSDQIIVKNYDDANKWLAQVRDMEISPDITDSTPGGAEGVPGNRAKVISASSRGWSTRTNGFCDPGNFQGD